MPWETFPPDCKAVDVWIDFLEDRDTKYFLLDGAVRSSKTYGSILAWVDWIEKVAPPGPLAMIGKTERTLRQNVLDPMQELLGEKLFYSNYGRGEVTICGRRVYIFGAPNIVAMQKLQGKGLVGAYCDEAPTYPYDVWQMLGTRTAADGIKIIATMNPDSPQHWMKKNYIDHLDDVNGRRWHFVLDDNPFLSDKVKSELRRQYTGLWKQRFIDGLWVMAEGAIYPHYQTAIVAEKDLPKTFDTYLVGCDYGTTNPFCYLMLGRYQNVWYVLKEFYYDSTDIRTNPIGPKVNKQYSDDLGKFLTGVYPQYIDIDPSEPSFIQQLRFDYPELHIVYAINTVIGGIQTVSQYMHIGKLKISDCCEKLIEELAGYVWDSKGTERGEDVPLKINDHACDALRYATMRVKQSF